MIYLNLATEAKLNTIADLAHTIWNTYYPAIIGQEQVNYMLNKFYSHQSLLEQIHKQKHTFYVIEKDEKEIGFISVSVSARNNTEFLIHKFYIDQQQSNKGIGTEVLNLLIKAIDPKILSLTVNRQNFKSINFYFKNGFAIESVADFDIGNNYTMNDFIMVRKLSGSVV